jgi:hypothetical protein
MLENLNTNMKVLIGISSIVIIGIIYSLVKKLFKPSVTSENPVQPINSTNSNSLKENNTNELKDISKNIKALHETHKDHMERMSEHMDNVEQHHNFINDTHHNVRQNKKTIILDNNNTNYNNSIGEITIKNEAVKNELGFPYAIHSMEFVSANIPKSGVDTPSVNLLIKDSKLEQFLGNTNILANIPLNHLSGSSTNEEFSHYKVPHIDHNIIRNPVTEHTLILQLVKSDGITYHDLTGKHYSFTIELIADQGIQVPENI